MGTAASKAHQGVWRFLSLTCCQWPSCCCEVFPGCYKSRFGGDFVVCAKYIPCCMCCQLNPERTVLLSGLDGAGKTTLLYYLLLHKIPQLGHNPTKGMNNEIVTFNKWQKYEFWDPAGSTSQRQLWSTYYNNILFDYVIYVINGDKWIRTDPARRSKVYDVDRMELYTLLHEDALMGTNFVVWVNFPREVTPKLQRQVLTELANDLDIGQTSKFADRLTLCAGYKQLLAEIQVDEEDLAGCFCP